MASNEHSSVADSANSIVAMGTDLIAIRVGTDSVPVPVGESSESDSNLTGSSIRHRLRQRRSSGARKSWRKSWLKARRRAGTGHSVDSLVDASDASLQADDTSSSAGGVEALKKTSFRVDTNMSADQQVEFTSADATDSAVTEETAQSEETVEAHKPQEFSLPDGDPIGASEHPIFNDLHGEISGQSAAGAERARTKSSIANMIEKAVLDFCSSRTVETMRRMFAGVTSELEGLQKDAVRSGDKTALAPHPITAELVKEGIVIGSIDVFAPRVHKEFCLEMKDSLVEGFLTDVGVFRSICYRTKCQLEVTRRLLNKKLCTGGRWVKFLIVRIVGPSLRAISSCDQLLQKAVPAFKSRTEYPKAAYCRMFFREDIPDNSLLYNNFQRTGGSSNRYGSLRLDPPYKLTTERTVGNCPWKIGALKVGKLSFTGAGSHLCMRQVYPGYGYAESTPVGLESKGVDALHRLEAMHGEFLSRRQALMHDRRAMTIPVTR